MRSCLVAHRVLSEHTMADALHVHQPYGNYDYYLTWFDGDEEGGSVGEVAEDGTGKEPKEQAEWEAWTAAKIAREMGATQDRYGLRWGSRAAAANALRAIKLAFKVRAAARPMPDWATKALAAGWKAPRGWTP